MAAMLIRCEFTNSTDFMRERVVLLTNMRMLVDGDGLLFRLVWDCSSDQPTTSIGKLHTAMHDSGFRMYLDRGGRYITMGKNLNALHSTIWFIGVWQMDSAGFYSKLSIAQRTCRCWLARRGLSRRRLFWKTVAARAVLGRLLLNTDVVGLIVARSLPVRSAQFRPDGPLVWIKPESDGEIFA